MSTDYNYQYIIFATHNLKVLHSFHVCNYWNVNNIHAEFVRKFLIYPNTEFLHPASCPMGNGGLFPGA
jgi:hypothetical protein